MEKDDFIRRKAAILMVQRYGVGCLDPDEFTPEQAERFVIARLQTIPAADVRPVKRGKWIDATWCGEDYLSCSICGYGALAHERTNYCPNCGAMMEG